MPQNAGAVDLSEAVDSFLQSFTAVRGMKDAKKQRETDAEIAVLKSALNDPYTTMKQKNDYYNQIIELAGGKKGVDFAGQQGLRQLEDTDVVVGSHPVTRKILDGTMDNPNTTPIPVGPPPDTNVPFGTYNKADTSVPQDTIMQPPIPIYQSKTTQEPTIKKYRDITIQEVQTLQEAAKNDRELAQRIKALQIERELVPKSYTYMRATEDVPAGNIKIGDGVWVNPQNPNDIIKSKVNLETTAEKIAREGGMKPTGTLKNKILTVATKLGLKTDDPKVLEVASEEYEKERDLAEEARRVAIARGNQNIAGNVPDTVDRADRIAKEARDKQEKRDKDIKDLEEKRDENREIAHRLDGQASKIGEEAARVNAEVLEMEKGKTPEELAELHKENGYYRERKDRYKDLQRQSQDKADDAKPYYGKETGAKEALERLGRNQGSGQSSGIESDTIKKLSVPQKGMIAAFKAANGNIVYPASGPVPELAGKKVSDMTDDEIYKHLKIMGHMK